MLSPCIYCFHIYKCLYAYIYTWFSRMVHHVFFDFHLLVFWFLSHKRKNSFLSIFSCKGSSAVPFIESESFDQIVPNSRCVSILYHYYLYIFPQLLLNCCYSPHCPSILIFICLIRFARNDYLMFQLYFQPQILHMFDLTFRLNFNIFNVGDQILSMLIETK